MYELSVSGATAQRDNNKLKEKRYDDIKDLAVRVTVKIASL